MQFFLKTETTTLFSYKTLTRFLVLLVLVLSIAAGYYRAALTAEKRKYMRIEDKYVRVRGELGVEKTQELIDESHQSEK